MRKKKRHERSQGRGDTATSQVRQTPPAARQQDLPPLPVGLPRRCGWEKGNGEQRKNPRGGDINISHVTTCPTRTCPDV